MIQLSVWYTTQLCDLYRLTSGRLIKNNKINLLGSVGCVWDKKTEKYNQNIDSENL